MKRQRASLARKAIAARAVLVLIFLGVLEGCTTPEQPDLNTYGAILPLCLLGCHIGFTLSEGDGATGSLSTSVSETVTTGGNSR